MGEEVAEGGKADRGGEAEDGGRGRGQGPEGRCSAPAEVSSEQQACGEVCAWRVERPSTSGAPHTGVAWPSMPADPQCTEWQSMGRQLWERGHDVCQCVGTPPRLGALLNVLPVCRGKPGTL